MTRTRELVYPLYNPVIANTLRIKVLLSGDRFKTIYTITKAGANIKSANLLKLALLNFMVETGEGRTPFTPKIKTLAERHAFWVAFDHR